MDDFLRESFFDDPETGLIFACIALGLLIACIVLIIMCCRYRRHYRDIYGLKSQADSELSRLSKEYSELNIQKNVLDTRVEELRKTKERISRIAYTDPLTELPNRNAVSDLLDGIMQTLSPKETVAVMMLNISNISDINNIAGYPGGEELLIDVTHSLSDLISEDDYLARFDTDRFMIVTQKLEDIEKYEKKLKLILSIFSEPFILSARECFADVSIGIALAPQDGNQPQVLVRYAQMALDMAKSRGRNNYCYFDRQLIERISERMELQAELKKAVEDDGFELMYKPRLEKDGRETGSLLAVPYWLHQGRGMLESKQFMDAARDDQTSVQIGKYVFENVCRQAEAWNREGISNIDVLMCVSERELFDQDYYEFSRQCLEKYETGRASLEFVIDAKVLLRNREGLEDTLNRFAALGIGFLLRGLETDIKRLGLGIEKDCVYGHELSSREAGAFLSKIKV